jgi:predicted nucleotidyltransferase
VEPAAIRESFEELLLALRDACRAHYGERLVSLAVFGSLGRGTPRADSDIDLFLVADPLPHGRTARVQEFSAVEAALAPHVARARAAGLAPEWSPVFRTPAEVEAGSLLLLDMIDDARLLVDRDGFLRAALDRFARRLARLGARRVWRGSAWYWDLKPDYRPGEVFEL